MKITTRKQAIDEKCRDCVYDPEISGTWVAQAENCGIPSCSLYKYRPKTSKTRKEELAYRVSMMTPNELAKHEAKIEAARKRFSSGKIEQDSE